MGVLPLCERFDTVGFLAHSVEDCALMLAASLGRRPMDTTVPTLGSARFAVLETLAMDGVRERPARGFDDAPARLARSGAQIERCSCMKGPCMPQQLDFVKAFPQCCDHPVRQIARHLERLSLCNRLNSPLQPLTLLRPADVLQLIPASSEQKCPGE